MEWYRVNGSRRTVSVNNLRKSDFLPAGSEYLPYNFITVAGGWDRHDSSTYATAQFAGLVELHRAKLPRGRDFSRSMSGLETISAVGDSG